MCPGVENPAPTLEEAQKKLTLADDKTEFGRSVNPT
jgi:hypothetical protein